MLLTESQLRRIIRKAILEKRSFDDELKAIGDQAKLAQSRKPTKSSWGETIVGAGAFNEEITVNLDLSSKNISVRGLPRGEEDWEMDDIGMIAYLCSDSSLSVEEKTKKYLMKRLSSMYGQVFFDKLSKEQQRAINNAVEVQRRRGKAFERLNITIRTSNDEEQMVVQDESTYQSFQEKIQSMTKQNSN